MKFTKFDINSNSALELMNFEAKKKEIERKQLEEADRIEQNWRMFNELFVEAFAQEKATKVDQKILYKIDERETYQNKSECKDKIENRKDEDRKINKNQVNPKLL